MRGWGIAIVVLAAACQQEEHQPQPAQPPETTFDGAQVSNAAMKIAHGRRVATMLGCNGCHGPKLQGDLFEDDPKFGTLYAANLSLALQHYSDADIEKLLREGRRPNGRDVWFMPSETFQHLSGPDMRALIAFLRSVPPGGKVLLPASIKQGAWGEIQGAVMVPAAEITAKTKDARPADLGEEHALGRYITGVTCAECHGHRLEGTKDLTPDLIIAGAYSRDEFERLMTTGTPKAGRKIKPLMSEMGRERFSRLTPHERDALYAYLKARAERPQ
jgi:mono/diheme cytochrome c family protein